MKRIHSLLLIFIASTIASLGCNAADNPTSTIKNSAEKFRKAPSISCNYTLRSASGSTSGTAIFAGDKFYMTSPEMTVWYDGRTQWSLVTAQQEVTVTEPTAEELGQINPFVIINTFSSHFTPKFTSKSTKDMKQIELTPKKGVKSDIRSAIVTIPTSTMLPSEIVVTDKSNNRFTITITSIKTGKQLPASEFTFSTRRFPKVEVIDLR